MLEDLIVAVPGDGETVELVRARLEELGLIGWVIDGARLGYDGWVLARLAADDEGALVSGSDEVLMLLELDELREALAATWPLAQVGDVVIEGHRVHGPACQSSTAKLHEVAVARYKGIGLDLEASLENLTLAAIRVGEKVVFSRVQPIDGEEHELLEVFTSAKGGSVVLWRRGPHTVLQVLRRSKEVELHVWEPRWGPLGADEYGELRDTLRPIRADAAVIAKVLGLPQDSVVPLRALLRREDPPLDELCDLLELPPETLRVISGECAVEDLPDAVIHEPEKLKTAVRKAMQPSDDDPAWLRWFDAGGRELKVWYVAWSMAFLVMCGWGLANWLDGGSAFWGVAALVGGLGTIADLLGKWIGKRRRASI